MDGKDFPPAEAAVVDGALKALGSGVWCHGDEATVASFLKGETALSDEQRDAFIALCPDELQEGIRAAMNDAEPDMGGLDGLIRETQAYEHRDEPTASVATGSDDSKRKPTVNELVAAMEGDDQLNLSIGVNELEGVPFVTGPTPWDATGEERRWTDADLSNLYAHMQGRYRKATRGDVTDAFTIFSNRRCYNPLTDELRTLAKHQRGLAYAPRLLPWFLGAEDDRYTQQVTLAWMRMAVCRAFRPGCLAQWMPVLYGPQGCGKSHFAALMALHPKYFTDSLSDLSNIKATAEVLSGRWIAEVAELDAMRGKDLEAVKATITRTDDEFRASYGRYKESHPRRSVFIATTNKAGFLRDRTGNRRFYPIAVGVHRPKYDMRDEDAVMPIIREAWGEVVAQYLEASRKARTDAEFLRLFPMEPPQDVQAMAEDRREDFKEANDNADAISSWLSNLPEGARVCTPQVAKEVLDVDTAAYSQNKRLQHELNEAMDTMPGWHRTKKKQRCGAYGIRRCWERDDKE